jgi:CelD/BcsL family acetyltransferase involved in cellulose biosynthesis
VNAAGNVGVDDGTWNVVPVGGPGGLAACESAWRAVLAGASTERLFLEPEWVLPWLEVFAARPRALFATREGTPRAAAILVGARLGAPGVGPLVLRPPGAGVSDYLDLLLPGDRACAAQAVSALLAWLVRAGGWDLLDLPGLPAEWPTSELVTAAAAECGLQYLQVATYRRSYIALEGSWQSYLASRSPNLRYKLRKRRRWLADELGEVSYRHYTQPDEVVAQLERTVEVHARRWRGQYTSTTYSSSPLARQFYARAAHTMAARGWVDLSTLEAGDRLLAFCLSFIRDRKLYYYLPAYDPELGRYAPSLALLAHLIETAYAQNLAEVDFMLGEEAYKDQWATGSRGTNRVLVAAPGPRGRAALAMFQAYLTGRERARRSPLLQRARRYGLGRLRASGSPVGAAGSGG